MIPTSGMLAVLDKAWRSPFRVKSDFARRNAVEVAALASNGHLTTKTRTNEFGQTWLITPSGLETLFEYQV